MPKEPPEGAEVRAELDGLLYAVSHDLRAPMRAIAGFAHALREELEKEMGRSIQGHAGQYLDRVEAATSRLQEMLDGLLALSRLSQQPLQLQSQPLLPLCQSLIDNLAPEHRAFVRLKIDPALIIDADPNLLAQALQALLDNACKFTAHLKQPEVLIAAKGDSCGIELCVADNGCGFDMRFVARLGVPFQHLHADTRLHGLGLGLASVRRIADRHGATLSAESAVDSGSRMILHWPTQVSSPH